MHRDDDNLTSNTQSATYFSAYGARSAVGERGIRGKVGKQTVGGYP